MTISVEAVIALPRNCRHARLELPIGATLADAATAALAHPAFAGIELEPRNVGIFGRRAVPETPVRDGDRVEFYRPLRLSPGDRRRALAASKSPAGG